MHASIETHRAGIAKLCRRHGVKRLDVFGSAARGSFDPLTSDVDLVVDLGEMEPVAYKRAYFALKRGLETLLGRPVDLVTAASLRNPHFIASISATREPVYG